MSNYLDGLINYGQQRGKTPGRYYPYDPRTGAPLDPGTGAATDPYAEFFK